MLEGDGFWGRLVGGGAWVRVRDALNCRWVVKAEGLGKDMDWGGRWVRRGKWVGEIEWFGEGDGLVRQKGLVREMGCGARRVREGEGLRGTWIGEDGLGQGNVYEEGDGLLEGDGEGEALGREMHWTADGLGR